MESTLGKDHPDTKIVSRNHSMSLYKTYISETPAKTRPEIPETMVSIVSNFFDKK